jgi:hypothetical protein
MAKGDRWTKDELRLAFHLYCQLPFGKLHSKNSDIIELASLIKRTPSSVAMKLVNFASLDPAITTTGRTGLGNASKVDEEIWNEYQRDWDGLAVHSARLLEKLRGVAGAPPTGDVNAESFYGATTLATVEVRRRQQFFRRSVLASYENKCCMTGITAGELLVASHIVPWNADAHNRLNPRNGLCLSALHDRAFDRGLITVAPDLSIRISSAIKDYSQEEFVRAALIDLDGHTIQLPEKFRPKPEFLEFHNLHVFKGR